MICNCFRRQSTLTKEEKEERKVSKYIEKQIAAWMKEYRKSIKILLLGAAESGKTTIIKQMKILHIKGFSDEERAKKAKEIRVNLLEAIQEITESLQQFDPDFRFANDSNNGNWSTIRNIRAADIENNSSFLFDEFFYAPIRELWSDPQVRCKFENMSGYSILDSAQYFLDKIDEIQKPTFVPTDADILRSRKRTTEIQKIEFEVKIPSKYGGGQQLFWMFDVGGQKSERRKWIQVFDGISAILFLISASEFDLMTREVSRQFSYEKVTSQAGLRFGRSVSVDRRKNYRENRMLDSLRLFQDICESRFLEFCGLICFLNKQDQLRDKIVNRKCSLSDYFEDYAAFDYEPKVNWLAEMSGSSDSGRRYANLRTYWRSRYKSGSSREGSINSQVVLDQLVQIDCRTQHHHSSRPSDAGDGDSMSSSLVAEQHTLSLELEYRKARNFIKSKFIRVAEQTNAKRFRKQQGNYTSAIHRKSIERECFFHYTIATDTDNIRTVFDDVQIMIILNNINQTILN